MEFGDMARLQTSLEPGVGEKKDRADVLFFFSSCIALVDLTVIHGQSSTHLGKASKALGAAVHAEREKMNHYDHLARSEGRKFFPLALETTGGIGPQGEAFLRLLDEETTVEVARAAFGILPFTFFTRTLGFQLQWCNANMTLKGCRLARGLSCKGMRHM